jgi:predicted ATPase
MDPRLVPQTLADVLGLREPQDRPLMDTMKDYLRNKKCLLIFDNCEHLLEACTQIANNLLRACPKLTILASSREALGLAGELPYLVPNLSPRKWEVIL